VNLPRFLRTPTVALRFVHGCDFRKEYWRYDDPDLKQTAKLWMRKRLISFMTK